MPKAKETASPEVQQPRPRAILVELENLGANGRQVFHDSLEDVFSGRGLKLNPSMFSVCCVGAKPAQAVSRLMKMAGKSRSTPEIALNEVMEKMTAAFLTGTLKPVKAFDLLLESAAKKNLLLGALCMLDLAHGKELAARIGFPDAGSNIVSCRTEGKDCPGPDAWLKVAKGMSLLPAQCVVIGTCATSCKGALSAGMKCVAIPDKYTGFQDFGGADSILDAFDDSAVNRVITLVESF